MSRLLCNKAAKAADMPHEVQDGPGGDEQSSSKTERILCEEETDHNRKSG